MRIASTLRRRMILTLGLLVLGSVAMGGGAMIAVNGLHQDLGSAVQGYRQLRELFTAGFFASRARDELSENEPQPAKAIEALQAAFSSLGDDRRSTDPPVIWSDESARIDCQSLIRSAIDEIRDHQTTSPSLNRLFARINQISEQVQVKIADTQTAADRKKTQTLWGIVGLTGVLFAVAVLVGVRQYQSVMGPVALIGREVRAFASGNFDRRIDVTGDMEFVSLAADFNQMAGQLHSLYSDLETKVRAQSKELLRAERLASVGYLASGVAHEINNPLGIITGYAERAIQRLGDESNDPVLQSAGKSLRIICEEAFRCKQITDRLLSLARPGSAQRSIVSLAELSQSVVGTLAGLGSVGDRSLKLELDSVENLRCDANEGELKQVLLNLIINALEATAPVTGQVLVKVWREYDMLHLSVTDNGHGMTSDTMNLIFQPFFTQKRGERPGTGLGLSIAHAIVTDHGGKIKVHSGGLSSGSTFTVILPAGENHGNG